MKGYVRARHGQHVRNLPRKGGVHYKSDMTTENRSSFMKGNGGNNMRKKLIAIIAVLCAAAFVLAACGGGNSGSGGSAGGGSTYDVGAFTVTVPSGWNAFPQTDMFGDKDASGNYPVDPETILLANATDELEAYSKPNVRIYYHKAGVTIFDSSNFYDNVKEISGVKVNGVECSAYEGESLGYTYQFVTYATDDATYEINVLTAVDGKDTGIKWDSAEVMSIMESLKTK